MAERMKESLLEEEKLVDLVVGPDAYRDLPRLLVKLKMGTRVLMYFYREKKLTQISVRKVRQQWRFRIYFYHERM